MTTKSEQIAKLNDAFRKSIFNQPHGRVLMTSGLRSVFNGGAILSIFEYVKDFNDFQEENDPYGEHDFGAFTYQDERIIWKFDYYDQAFEYHSADPANPDITNRVLTIMLGSDW